MVPGEEGPVMGFDLPNGVKLYQYIEPATGNTTRKYFTP